MKSDTTFPFTADHIAKFKEELERAGGFVALMKEKRALTLKDGINRIAIYKDSEEYKKKFLTGVYASLQPFYDDELPYLFWSALYELLEKQEDIDS